jgi:signal transduction histidine kinase
MSAAEMLGTEAPQESARSWRTRRPAWWVYWIVLGLACATVLITGWQSYRSIDRELTGVALARRAEVAHLAAVTLSEKLARLEDITVSLATRVRFSELVAAGEFELASGILQDAPRDFPFIERLFLADADGTLRADVPFLPGVRGRNFAYREWYQGVRAGWQPFVTSIYRRAASPQVDVFAVAAPIRSPAGEVAGILVLQFRIDRFFDWLNDLRFAEEEFVYVVDRKGRVAFHSRRPRVEGRVLDYSNAPVVRNVSRGARGVETAYDPHEERVLVSAYAPVPTYGWGAVAAQPAEAAFAAKDQQLGRLLAAYGAIAFLFFSGIYLVSRLIIARRRTAEDQRLRAELERRVSERTAQLEAANKELEGFSYSVSHDLRAPLRAIDGFSRMLEEDHGDRLDDAARELIRVVRDNARRMGQLIDDLLAFSRTGRKALDRVDVDMSALVAEVHAGLGTSCAGAKLELTPLPRASCDPALLRQVWVNLLSNACKFSAGRPAPRIEVTGREAESGEKVYCVRDNGVGFDMAYYGKLFGVFQRLHSEEEFPGTGVGLAIVQRVIARHGGRVWAEAKPGEGAAFFFTLPGGASNAGSAQLG